MSPEVIDPSGDSDPGITAQLHPRRLTETGPAVRKIQRVATTSVQFFGVIRPIRGDVSRGG